MEHHVSRVQVICVVLFAVLCVSSGEALLSAGMKQVGKSGAGGWRFVLAAGSDWHVLVGTGLMAAFFACTLWRCRGPT